VDSDPPHELEVAWDYHAFPIWAGPGGPVVSGEEFAVSAELRRALQSWSDDVTGAMWGPHGPDAPDNHGPSEDTLSVLDDRGRRLADRVRSELGPTYSVRYRPILSGEGV
jgi:hypothetical protein